MNSRAWVWRDDIRHGEAEPWAAEWVDFIEGLQRRWFPTWFDAYVFAYGKASIHRPRLPHICQECDDR